MNDDILTLCYKAFENDCYNYVIFSESTEGEISYYGMRDNEHVEHLYKDYYGKDRAKFHLFKFEKGQLNWIESYDFKTKMVDIPVDISDEAFLMIAKEAHKKNITFNDEVISLLKQYINSQVRI
jgi:hypothetical protein